MEYSIVILNLRYLNKNDDEELWFLKQYGFSKLRMMITHLFTKVSDEQRNFVTHLQETWKFFKASIVIGF